MTVKYCLADSDDGGFMGRKCKKTVQTKNDENERDQISRDDGSDLHKVFLLGMNSSGNDAGLIKTKTRAARVELCSIAVADVAKEVRLPGGPFEKSLIHLGIIKSRHRPGIQAKRAGGE